MSGEDAREQEHDWWCRMVPRGYTVIGWTHKQLAAVRSPDGIIFELTPRYVSFLKSRGVNIED